MRLDVVAHLVGDPVNRTLEALVAESLDAAAVAAHQVVVVILGGRALEASAPLADLYALHHPQLGEQVERSVDAREADAPVLTAEAVEDLLRRQAALLSREEIDDCPLCRAASMAGNSNSLECRVGPLSHRRSIFADGSLPADDNATRSHLARNARAGSV